MNNFPIDVLQHYIINQLDFLSQIRFRQICKWFHRLEIHDFKNIDRKYFNKLSDNILVSYPFIRYLNAFHNPKITNVNYMLALKELNASGCECGIGYDGIKDLNLVKLKACGNPKITNANHMTNLKN